MKSPFNVGSSNNYLERLPELDRHTPHTQHTPQKYATLYRIDATSGLSYISVDQACIS